MTLARICIIGLGLVIGLALSLVLSILFVALVGVG